MSGGVDSSVAAWLTVQQGYDCIGVTMRLYDNDEIGLAKGHPCCTLDDVEDARSVAFRLGIPHYTFNFRDAFKEKVIDPFVRCYEEGGTPNPCIECNRHLKFRDLYHRAQVLGCERLVTGHYARIVRDEKDGRYRLLKAKDSSKDQSYVLYMLPRTQLAVTSFPLGEFTKEEARQLAEKQGFLNARKHDSQDICFVPDGDYAAFIRRYTGKSYPDGDFVTEDGTVLGRHKGIICYTIGQRRGLGLSLPAPLYVCGKNTAEDKVILGPSERLFRRELRAVDCNFLAWEQPPEQFRCRAKTRYSQKEANATVTVEDDGIRLTFDDPQRAITPGQAVVFYDGDEVLGGGTISEVL